MFSMPGLSSAETLRIAQAGGWLEGEHQPADVASAPIALLIPGSGPTDRDGNNPLGVRAATLRLLAQELASRGVATVRIDKRGMFGSASALADANAVTIADYANDVRAWAAELRARFAPPCLWLIGHSEGGLVALEAAQRGGVCGVVLLAAPGRPLGEVLRSQLRDNPANAPILSDALAAIGELEVGRRMNVSGFHPALQRLLAPPVQGYLIDAMSRDPVRLIGSLAVPALIIQGARDLQVSVADAERLKAAKPDADLVILPDANHVLKTAPADRAGNIATYANANLPLAHGLADRIAAAIIPESLTPNSLTPP
jgi:hypothetical protein